MINRIGLKIVVIVSIFLVILAVFYIKDRTYKPKPIIAIVIDDWGYSVDNLSVLYSIKRPLTLAILPNLKYSKKIAQEADKKGFETILHLPLESKGNKNPEAGTIRCDMGKQEIIEKLDLALQSVPGISGVSNHQGSKATENKDVMSIILKHVENKGLFFLDSRTSSRSVCKKMSEMIGLKFAERDIFLDLPSSVYDKKNISGYIRVQLHKLAQEALKKGYAIGIGHDRKVTLNIIKEVAPALEKMGLRFVRVNDVIKYRKKMGRKRMKI